MGLKWWCTVEDDTQTLNLKGGGNVGAINRDEKTVGFGECWFCTDQKKYVALASTLVSLFCVVLCCCVVYGMRTVFPFRCMSISFVDISILLAKIDFWVIKIKNEKQLLLFFYFKTKILWLSRAQTLNQAHSLSLFCHFMNIYIYFFVLCWYEPYYILPSIIQPLMC